MGASRLVTVSWDLFEAVFVDANTHRVVGSVANATGTHACMLACVHNIRCACNKICVMHGIGIPNTWNTGVYCAMTIIVLQ